MSDYSSNFPQQRPVFSFNADAGKLDSRISFSRADTPPTYAAPSAVHYWSNEKHLSSENLLLDSKTGTANWTADFGASAVAPTITANHAASPDGTASQATRVQLNLNGQTSGSDYSRYQQAGNVASGTSATFCIWARSTDGASSYAAQLLAPDGSGTAITITGTWQKFSTTATSAGNLAYGVRLRGGQTPTNADTADILLWGANLSTTGQTVLSETTSQIHREFAPTLKSVSTSGQPRFEYSPADGQSVGTPKGLLVESQSSNLAIYSDDVSNWGGSTGIISGAQANACVGPTGSMAYAIVEPTIANTHYASINVSGQDYSAAYTASVYIKKLASGSGTKQVKLRINGMGGQAYAAFDLDSGAVVQEAGTAFNSATISSVSNGWYRISMTYTNQAADRATGMLLVLSNGDSASLPNYTGDGYTAYGVANFQFEKSSFPSSPISTSGASATRAADSCSVDSATLFDNGDTTVMCDVTVPTDTGTVSGGTSSRFFRLENSSAPSTGENYEVYRTASGQIVAEADAGGANVASYYVANSSPAGNYKLAVRYGSDSKAYLNGAAGVSSDSAMPNPSGLDTLRIGSYSNTGGILNGHIGRLSLYSVALSNEKLQSLTS